MPLFARQPLPRDPRLAALLALALLALACGARPDGRLREIQTGQPAPAGGPYALADEVTTRPLAAPAHNLTLHGDVLYVFMNEGGIGVFDVSTPSSPTLVRLIQGVAETGPARRPAGVPPYCFSGIVVGRDLFVSDRAGRTIFDFDLADPRDPRYVGSIHLGAPPIHLLPLGDRLLVAMGNAGLIEIPSHPASGAAVAPRPLLGEFAFVKQMAFYPGTIGAPDGAISRSDRRWLLVADTNTNDGILRVIDLADPARPRTAAVYQVGTSCDVVLPFAGFAAVGIRRQGIRLLDLDDPARPFLLSRFSGGAGDIVSSMARWGAAGLVIGQGNACFDLLDLADPRRPVWLGRFPTGRPVNCLAVNGDWLYVGTNWPGGPAGSPPPPRLQVWRLRRAGAAERPPA